MSFVQRRHCLLFLISALFSLKGKVFSVSDNPSLDSVDSEYDMGSVQRDLNFLEDNPSLKDIMLANQPSPRMASPFISLRPANPTMQALTSQRREAHNRSPVSFREGRRASDTSLTQGNCRSPPAFSSSQLVGFEGGCGHIGIRPVVTERPVFYLNCLVLPFLAGIVAFRQHLQNLARTKGILELNKVQLLYEQLGPEADPSLASAAPQLQDLAGGRPQVSAPALSTVAWRVRGLSVS